MPVSVATSTVDGRGVAGGLDHAAGRQDLRAGRRHGAGRHEVQRRRGAPALRVHEQLGVGCSATRPASSAPLMPAWTWHSPIQMCMLSRPVTRCTWAPRNWSGQNSTSWSAGIDWTTSDGVRRGAADVGLGLHCGRRVDVADHHRARMLGLPGAELVGRDRLGEAAAGGGRRGSAPSCPELSIFADSAMKCTPQNTIVDARRPRRRSATTRASRRCGGRCPGSPAAGSCGPGSLRRVRRRGGAPVRCQSLGRSSTCVCSLRVESWTTVSVTSSAYGPPRC